MSIQITKRHLNFVHEAAKVFETNSLRETFRRDGLIALRMGMDRDCVEVFEIGDSIANFVQQLSPNPNPRQEVREFAFEMEGQLIVNRHKGGWKREHWEFLKRELNRSYHKLVNELNKEDHDKQEITIKCANIANFAMMIADNYGTLREEK